MDNLLRFPQGNAKLDNNIHTFSLPAGYSCPGADACLTKADRYTGKVTDGYNQAFRCFAASQEAAFPEVRKARWHNYDLLRQAKTREGMRDLILQSLPAKARLVRVHVSGDFFNEEYFLAWMDVARLRPDVRFYAYTKSVHLWRRLQEWVPTNFVLTASMGGKYDTLTRGLKTATTVFSIEEARSLGLEVDHDDSHAHTGTANFANLLHGTQPKGSAAAAAFKRLRAAGKGGYNKAKAKTTQPLKA